jgi:hypothetical protein
MKIMMFWNVTPCSLEGKNSCSWAICYLGLQESKLRTHKKNLLTVELNSRIPRLNVSRTPKMLHNCHVSVAFWWLNTSMACFFFNLHIGGGGGIRTGSTRHLCHLWPVTPDPGEWEVGEFCLIKICRRNRSTRRKHAPAPIFRHKSHMSRTGREPEPPRWEASE